MILSVVKKVENPDAQVDCVTGATLTSNGVDAMLKEGLKPLKNYAINALIEGVVNADSVNVEPKAEEE